MRRFVFMVLDGVGVGAQPDAAAYGDEGANTLGNLARYIDLELPNLQALGLGNLVPLRGLPPVKRPGALAGRLRELSAGKDTTNGHWEHMGLVSAAAFPTYPDGFPEEVLRPFRERIGRDVLGNKTASGTEIIRELGEQHMATGRPIVYTSADSVFQIACHVEVVPLEELYRYCEVARGILTGPHAVGRVIARPFTGEPGAFVRTKDRQDFSLEPTSATYLDLLAERGVPVIGIGKIHQIFAGQGVTEEHKVASNAENLDLVARFLRQGREGLIFTNLVDFDMLWGHRNDLEGFAAGLRTVDQALPGILDLLGPADRLLLTADHGVDPTTVSTDHSREYVPLLYIPRPPAAPAAAYCGTMADTGATAFRHLTGEWPPLTGRVLDELNPEDGWKPYPTVFAYLPAVSCRVGDSEAREAANVLGRRLGSAPETAVILGSGLDLYVEGVKEARGLAYAEIPHWPEGSVMGHRGRLLVGRRQEVDLCVLRGRVHSYEGFDLSELQLPVRTLALWGVRRLVVTNACGGLDPGLRVGEVVRVELVLDLQTPESDGRPACLPVSPADPSAGLPTPDTRPVTYVALPGPQYETAAEVRAFRALEADVVGMSTAAEVRAATAAGLSVIVLSVVTNPAGQPAKTGAPAHQEVMDVSSRAVPFVHRLVDYLLGV